MFLLLGIFIIYLAQAGKLAMENSSFQTSVNIFMSNSTVLINNWISKLPLIFWVVLVLLLAVVGYKYVKNRRKKAMR